MTRPTASPPYFPYLTHRTMAEVMHDERMDAFWRRSRVARRQSRREWEKTP